MKPYYERNGIVLFHGDALEVLPTLPRGSVHLLLTDPPYGVSFVSSYAVKRENHKAIAGDHSTECAEKVLAAAYVALREGRHVYSFGVLPPHSWLKMRPSLVWDKCILGMGDLSDPFGVSHETIHRAVCSKERKANGKANERFEHDERLRRPSVLRYQRPHGAQCDDHPTIKPVPLLRELIECSSKFGETVLDPFAGSGSTPVAAYVEGRKAIGIEIEERYCEVAARRLDAAMAQGELFRESTR